MPISLASELTMNAYRSGEQVGPDRPLAIWLFVCCAMIFLMVVLGGATRLTHSGLSMVEWRPVTGILPPLNDVEWQATFDSYKQSPEFQKVNIGMDVEGFKSIFWLEYIHRLWGRLIGLVFLIPFIYFMIRKRVSRTLFPKLLGMFVLGGLQGLLGWYMVKSGLVDRPDVSQYRLAAHLGLAFLIYVYILWIAIGLYFERQPVIVDRSLVAVQRSGIAIAVLVFVTAMSGAFVAGLDAGHVFNTFPLMDGSLVPDGLFVLEPVTRNLFENIITVQFNHRLLALTTFAAVVAMWWWLRRWDLPSRTRTASHLLLAAAVLQVTLGISTLVLVVPVPLGIAHQAGALLLLTAVVWLARELSSP